MYGGTQSTNDIGQWGGGGMMGGGAMPMAGGGYMQSPGGSVGGRGSVVYNNQAPGTNVGMMPSTPQSTMSLPRSVQSTNDVSAGGTPAPGFAI